VTQRESKTVETDLFQDEQSLFEKLYNPFWLGLGFGDVKRNQGAPGVDGVTIETFENNYDEELSQLSQELESWTYKPHPVRGVEIAKPDGGVRRLGIPVVRDRVVHATLKRLLEPILTPQFSENSFGFIAGRNQEQAVKQAKRIVTSGKEWIVDIDLSKFFDRVHHDRLISRLGNQIEDKRILRIIGMILRSGIMKEGLVSPTPQGTVQGSPLSPLLSNVVLDELDKELESRGLEFCRFADDCNLFVKTHKAAQRVMDSISGFIEKKLKLKINQEKSQVARSEKVKFLGMTIVKGNMAISAKSLNRAMKKVKELTPRGTHLKLENAIEEINQWYRGWSSYYSMTQYPAQLAKIEAHIRRRLRSRLVDQQKSQRSLLKKLIKRNVRRRLAAKAVFSNNKRWSLSHTRAVEMAYPNRWFIKEMGLYIRSAAKLDHWFGISAWIRLV
jgi:RNA-directed DNA polymerase